MAIMGNKWIEKEGMKSIKKTTAPSYDPYKIDDSIPINPGKPIKRHTKAARANIVRTLRGVRR